MDVYYKCLQTTNCYLRNRYTILIRFESSSVTQGSHSRQWTPCFWWLVKALAWKPHNQRITERLLKRKRTVIHLLNTYNSLNINLPFYSLYLCNITHENIIDKFQDDLLWTKTDFYLCAYLTDLQWYQQRGPGCQTKGELQSSCSGSRCPFYQNRSLKSSLNTHIRQ